MTLVAVPLRGEPSDSVALRWAARHLETGDELHLIRAYRELAVQGSTWPPAVHAAEVHRSLARHSAADAERQARELVPAGHAVSHSIVCGDRTELSCDLATFVDTLVMAVPAQSDVGYALTQARRIAGRGAQAEHGGCSVVLVPERWTPAERGEVMFADPSGSLSWAAMNRAVAAAGHTGAGVRVLHPDEPGAIAHLCARLSRWRASGFAADPGARVVCDVAAGHLPDALRRLDGDVLLLVEDWSPGAADVLAAAGSGRDLAMVALGELHVPVMLVVEPDERTRERIAAHAASPCLDLPP